MEQAEDKKAELGKTSVAKAADNPFILATTNSVKRLTVSQSTEKYSVDEFAGDLLRTAAYSAIAAPAEGLLQSADQIFGSKMQGKSRNAFESVGVTAPAADAMGAKWLAQTIGQAGMALPLLLTHKPIRALLVRNGGAAMLNERTTLGFTLRESVATGFVQGSVLSPTESQSGFLAGRIDSGISSALVFGGMTAANHRLNKFAETGMAFKYGLNRVLTNPLAAGVISGVPGGALSAEVEAVKEGNVLPSGARLGESILSQSLMGGLFGAKHLAAENKALAASVNSTTQSLLSHPDVKSLIRAPRLPDKSAEYLDKMPGTDVSLPAPTSAWHKAVLKPAEPGQASTLDGNYPELSGGSIESATWRLGKITRAGRTYQVQDEVNGVSRKYVGGRLIEAVNSVDSAAHTYAYNSSGELRAIITGPNQGWFKARDGWAMGRIDQTGRLSVFPAQADAAKLTTDGVIFSKGEKAWSLPLTARFLLADEKGAALTHRNMKREQAITDMVSTGAYAAGQHTTRYVAEDGRPLSVPEEIKAFRKEAAEHGLKQGYGQLESEVNRSLASGNEAEALGLLLAARKLLPKEGVNTLAITRNTEGKLSVIAEGYANDKHVRYLLDGTKIETGQMMRTTNYPDGTRLEETFSESESRTSRYNKNGALEEIKFGSSQELTQHFSYNGQGEINSVVFRRNGSSTSLTNEGGRWLIKQETEANKQEPARVAKLPEGQEAQTSVLKLDLGPGEVTIHADGSAYFSGPESRRYLYETAGMVTLGGNSVSIDLPPGSPMRVRFLDLAREEATGAKMAEKLDEPVRETFHRSSAELMAQMQKTGIDELGQAVLVGEVNSLLTKNPQAAIKLQSTLVNVLRDTDSAASVRADRTPGQSTIHIGNKAVEISQGGTVSIHQGPPVRLAGTTGTDFLAKVKEGLKKDVSASISRLLAAHDIAVVAGPNISEIAPGQAKQKPPGWPNGSTGDALGAVYDPQKNIIAVAEKHNAYVREGVVNVKTENPRLEMLRAVGQAVDAITGISRSGEFKKAYIEDESNLKAVDKLAFYRNGNESENFSVTFVDLFTGTQIPTAQADLLAKYYPRTATLVKESIENLKGKELTLPKREQVMEEPKPDGHPAEPGLSIEKQPYLQKQIEKASGGSQALVPQFVQDYLERSGINSRAAEIEAVLSGKANPPAHLEVVRNADGATVVTDHNSQVRRVYDRDQRLTNSTSLAEGGKSQSYIYDDNGLLKAAIDDQTAYLHTSDGWRRVSINKTSNIIRQASLKYGNVTVHPDGGILLENYGDWETRMVTGRNQSIYEAETHIDGAVLSREKQNLDRTIARAGLPNAPELSMQISKLLESGKRNDISSTQQGSVMAELARQFEKDPSGAQRTLKTLSDLSLDEHCRGMWVFEYGDGHTTVKVTTQNGFYLVSSDGTIKEALQTSYGTDTTTYGPQKEIISKQFEPNDSVKRTLQTDSNGISSVVDDHGYSGTYSVVRQGANYVRVVRATDGKESSFDMGPGTLEVARDNSLVFTPKEAGKPRIIHSAPDLDTLVYANERTEIFKFNGRRDFVSADPVYEGRLLRENMRTALSRTAQAGARIERFERMLAEFENKPAEGKLARNKQALVLLQLNRLMEDTPSMLGRAQRAQLAEQLLAHALNPLKIWQGGHPTCNVATVEHRLMVQAPDKLIALVADAVNNGAYTTTEGKTFQTSNLTGMFAPDSEASSNLTKQANPYNAVTHDLGERDWASQIAQISLLRAAWLGKKFYLSGNQLLADNSVAYLKDTSGNKRAVLLEPEDLKPLDVRDTANKTVFLDSGNIGGMIAPKDYQPLLDRQGKPIVELKAGDTAYDAYGRPLVYRPMADELVLGNTLLSEHSLARLTEADPQYLVDKSHELLTEPQMVVEDIAAAYRAVDSDSSLGANIIGFQTNSGASRNVTSVQELVDTMAEQHESSRLPAILLVHTRSQAFGHWQNGGYHVVNLYEPLQSGKMLRYSNQWGTSSDFMQQGALANLLLSAMKTPIKASAMPAIAVPISMPGIAREQVGYAAQSATSDVNSKWFKPQGWLNFLNSRRD